MESLPSFSLQHLMYVVAPEDEEWCERLDRHLRPLQQRQLILTWSSQLITAGTDRQEELAIQMASSSIVILLLSSDFMASDECVYLMMQALKMRKSLLPVLVRPVAWHLTPIANLSLLPQDGKPIVLWANYDAALLEIANAIRSLVDPQKTVSLPSAYHLHDNKHIPFMVGDIPADFVERPSEFENIIHKLLDKRSQEPIAITAALRGAGGYGKTTLARAICYDERVRKAFNEGILWVTLGENPNNIVGKLEDLIFILNKQRPGFTSIEAASAYLANLLTDKSILLVIDDVWHEVHLRPFLQGAKTCVRLITTRDESVLPVHAQKVLVDSMSSDEAFQLLSFGILSLQHTPVERRQLYKLANRLGEWPLLLKLVNRVLLERINKYKQPLKDTFAYVNKALDQKGLAIFDAKNAQERDLAIEKTLSVSFEQLTPNELACYQKLAIFPEDTVIPLEVVHRLWHVTHNLDEIDTEMFCQRLHDLSLLLVFDPLTKSIRLHDVIRSYLQQLISSQLPTLHGQLLNTYLIKRWADLPNSHAYMWNMLFFHLMAAGRLDVVISITQDLLYFARKTFLCGTSSIEIDLDLAEKNIPDDPLLPLLKRRITQISHILARGDTLQDIAGIMLSCLSHIDELTDLCRKFEQDFQVPLLKALYPLPDLPSVSLLRTFQGHTGVVHSCAVSLLGELAISASADRTLKVWDTSTGKLHVTLQGHIDIVTDCSISPSGEWIVSASADKTLKIWDTQTGQERLTLYGHTDSVNGCAISPSGEWIVSASADKTLKIWDTQTGQERLTLYGHTNSVNGCAISPSGEWIVSASADKTLKIWDASTGTELYTLGGHNDFVNDCAIDPNENWIISVSADHTLRLWDVHTQQAYMTIYEDKNWIDGCAISPSGESLIITSNQGKVKIRDTQTGEEFNILRGHKDRVTACVVDRENNRVLSSSNDKTLKMWDMSKIDNINLHEHTERVNSCAVSLAGEWIVSASRDQTLKVWDIFTRTVLFTLQGHQNAVHGCAISPSGEWIVSASADNTLKIWDVHTRTERLTLQGHEIAVRACAISPSGEWIVSASADQTLKIWDIHTGQERLTLKGHQHVVNSCAVDPSGKWIVSASWDRTLKVWNASTGDMNLTLEGHLDWVNSCVISSTGQWIVSASDDKTLKIWNAHTGQERCTLHGHRKRVITCAISPNEDIVVSSAEDQTIRVWDAYNGKCLATLHIDSLIFNCCFLLNNVDIIASGESGLYFLHFDGGTK